MITNEKKICIIGAGGFGREVLCCLIDAIAATNLKIEEIASFMVSDKYLKESKIMNIEVLPLSTFDPLLYNVVVAIGDPLTRKMVIDRLPCNTKFTTIIHPTAIISEWAEIGEGSIITAGTIVTCNIKIGKHAQLNLHTTIGHDCIIGDFFTTGPAVNISGNCKIGNYVYFGTDSAVRQGITICNNVTIGMGGIVVKDILEEGVYIGNPLRILERK
ncbi:MAG: acetyltransferase [Bacteroidales bacterium]|nr:acetyltransferase [Bacteroidales bacterium]MDZ4203375.1 acetyltransferase [Bacteroidales bacterium]